jgi:hypothetical protein
MLSNDPLLVLFLFFFFLDDCLFVWGDNTYGALGTKRGVERGSKGLTKDCVNRPTQLRKFGRRKVSVETVEAGVHATFVITKAPCST